MKRKIFAVTLALTMALGTVSAVSGAQTRIDALVSVIRAAGKESEALEEEGEHPFTDVPKWADKYVAYAYKNNIVKGVGNNVFDSEREITADEYGELIKRVQTVTDADTDTNEDVSDENVIGISEQGMFSSGGTVTEPADGEYDPSSNWLDMSRSGNTAHIDHANVLYQIPEDNTELPMVFLHGYGQSTAFWKDIRVTAREFAESYNADGGNCTVVNLPDKGITGNSHFMFQEMNSEEIAEHIENWIQENVE